MSSNTQKKVVIVGGQFAGRKALTLLEKDFDVTIVDEKEYFEYTPAALRAIVEPAHAAKIIVDRPRATKVARAERIELTDGKSRALDASISTAPTPAVPKSACEYGILTVLQAPSLGASR
jgi:NADH dehydrogenase FAD-containing subunit